MQLTFVFIDGCVQCVHLGGVDLSWEAGSATHWTPERATFHKVVGHIDESVDRGVTISDFLCAFAA